MRLPNLLIIGAGKCGTTSLHRYLARHPDICMSPLKELNFFLGGKAYERGPTHYASLFPADSAEMATVVGESSPSYTNYPRYLDVPDRAHAVVPDAKLIYCVRDPIDRIVSHFRMERARSGRADLDFEQVVVRGLNNPYVRMSKYWLQLSQWLDHWQLSDVFIVEQERLKEERSATLAGIFAFLGLETSVAPEGFEELHWTADQHESRAFGSERPAPVSVRPRARRTLVQHLRDDVDEFRRRTGRAFDAWSL